MADELQRLNLMPVILWLENGCDPKEAAKELRFYQLLLDAGKLLTNGHRANSDVHQNDNCSELPV